jgi:hypothetical protein
MQLVPEALPLGVKRSGREADEYTNSILSSPSSKPPVAHLLKNFRTLYGTRSFVTVFTRNCHWSLTWARWIQFTPSYRSIFRERTSIWCRDSTTSNVLNLSQPDDIFARSIRWNDSWHGEFVCAACLTYKTLRYVHRVYLCVPWGSHNKQRLFP